MNPKIIGIGLNKTGTTTLEQCLKGLGYSMPSAESDRDMNQAFESGDLERILATLDRFDAVVDWPWPFLYEQIDGLGLDVRFVLTVRESREAWLSSQVKHYAAKGPLESTLMYFGHCSPIEHETAFLQVYEDHNARVRDYFAGRDDFAEFCWENGDAWTELCAFARRPVPDLPFPHANARSMSDAEFAVRLNTADCLRHIKENALDLAAGALSRIDLREASFEAVQGALRAERDLKAIRNDWPGALHAAIQIDLPDAQAYRDKIELGVAYTNCDQLENAAAAFQSGVEINPNDVNGWGHLARTLYLLNRQADAETAIRRCLDNDPRSANGHQLLAAILAAQGRREEAVIHADEAIELMPGNPDFLAFRQGLEG